MQAISPFLGLLDIMMNSLYQSPWKLLLLSTLLSAAAAQIGIPTSLSIDYDLSQKHVRVSRTRVAQQFITDIQNIALATIQNSYPDKHIEVINRPSGPTLQWKDMTLALEEVWITTADERKVVWFRAKAKTQSSRIRQVRRARTLEWYAHIRRCTPQFEGMRLICGGI